MSRKPQDSMVQPRVRALGKKNKTTFFLPLKSAGLRVSSLASGRTFLTWVAFRRTSGTGSPSFGAACAPAGTAAPTRAQAARTRKRCGRRMTGLRKHGTPRPRDTASDGSVTGGARPLSGAGPGGDKGRDRLLPEIGSI